MASKPATQPPSWLSKRPVLSIFGLLFLIMMVFFFETIFTGKTYQSPDAQAPSAISVPLKKALWEEGSIPLWIPYIFGGMPNFSPPFAYFPDAVDEIIGRVIPIRRMLMFALHYVLAGLGVFLFLRRRGVATLPGIVGGLAFMLTPYLITMTIFGHGSQMMTAAYLPLALWAVDRLFERVSLLNIGLAGLIIGLMLQRGHIQIACAQEGSRAAAADGRRIRGGTRARIFAFGHAPSSAARIHGLLDSRLGFGAADQSTG